MKNFYEHCDKCSECGRFVSYKSPMIVYTPYGSCTALEPPDEAHICESCWRKLTPSQLVIIDKISWLKPQIERRNE